MVARARGGQRNRRRIVSAASRVRERNQRLQPRRGAFLPVGSEYGAVAGTR